ncbi:MAG: type II toxin-antitoxin system VapC family toxin [Phycisphaerales bacterium]|nr:type II toxin-antitoxin system VapC family toxin [Phycisphaerales bacterium]
MRILTDSNILIRLTQESHPSNAAARKSVDAIRGRGDTPCIVPQVIYEYWAVCTRPIENNGLGMTIEQTRSKAEELQQVFRLLRDERGIFDRWEELVTRHDVKGKNTHDARLAAAMLRHGITHVLTFDATDFKRFSEISVLVPEDF